MAHSYDIGDVVVLTAEFRVSNTLTDPTTVVCEIKTPNGTVVTLTPTMQAAGIWRVEYMPSQIGVHEYRFVGTGAAAGSERSFFRVQGGL